MGSTQTLDPGALAQFARVASSAAFFVVALVIFALYLYISARQQAKTLSAVWSELQIVRAQRLPLAERSASEQADHQRVDSAAVRFGRLPQPTTSFISREVDINEIWDRLAHSRLVTLTGAGGSGKTRLAIEVAEQLRHHYSDGLCFVALETVSKGSLADQKVATELGLKEEPGGQPFRDTIASFLAAKSFLLVFDNCEHLIEAVRHLSRSLLEECRGLTILATSREALGVPGEARFEVPLLETPDQQITPEEGMKYAAIRLFVERVRDSQSEFQLRSDNLDAVIRICRRLDGIPLAIELAAALVGPLAPDQIAQRLEERFGLLARPPGGSVPRHQTLHASIDWSYELLPPDEQLLLARLGVFRGGWTLEGAEAICADKKIANERIASLSTRLQEKSLIRVASGSEASERFQLLETMREYAFNKLTAQGEYEPTAIRHASYYRAMAEENDAIRAISWTPRWWVQLEQEHDNFRLVLSRSRDETFLDPDGALGLNLAVALSWFWFVRDYIGEGRTWIMDLLSRSAGCAPHLRLRALTVAGILARIQGDDRCALDLIREAIALSSQMPREESRQSADFLRAGVALLSGDFAAAAEHASMLQRVEQVGLPWAPTITRIMLGAATLFQEKYEDSQKFLSEALDLTRESRDLFCEAYTRYYLGLLFLYRGNLDAASIELERSASLHRKMENKGSLAISLTALGQLEIRRATNLRKASAYFADSLALALEVGRRQVVADCLAGFAGIATRIDRWVSAARLFGAAERLRVRVNAHLPKRARRDQDEMLRDVRHNLGTRPFRRASEEGAAAAVDEMVNEGLSILPPLKLAGSACA